MLFKPGCLLLFCLCPLLLSQADDSATVFDVGLSTSLFVVVIYISSISMFSFF